MNHRIISPIVLTQFVDLGMAIMTAGNTIVGTGCFDLVILYCVAWVNTPTLGAQYLSRYPVRLRRGGLHFPIGKALFLKSGLEKPPAPTAAIIVGAVGLRIDKIFFPHHRFDHKPQVFGNGIPIAFPDNLTGILDCEFDLKIFVPVGIDRKFSFTDPLGIVFINIFYVKIVFKVKFFQSCQD